MNIAFSLDEQYLFELYFGETGDIRKTEVGGIRIKILQCGNNHILLIDNYNKLYSFGLGRFMNFNLFLKYIVFF